MKDVTKIDVFLTRVEEQGTIKYKAVHNTAVERVSRREGGYYNLLDTAAHHATSTGRMQPSQTREEVRNAIYTRWEEGKTTRQQSFLADDPALYWDGLLTFGCYADMIEDAVSHKIAEYKNQGHRLTQKEMRKNPLSRAVCNTASVLYGSWTNALQANGVLFDSRRIKERRSPSDALDMLIEYARSHDDLRPTKVPLKLSKLLRRSFTNYCAALIAAAARIREDDPELATKLHHQKVYGTTAVERQLARAKRECIEVPTLKWEHEYGVEYVTSLVDGEISFFVEGSSFLTGEQVHGYLRGNEAWRSVNDVARDQEISRSSVRRNLHDIADLVVVVERNARRYVHIHTSARFGQVQQEAS